MTLQVICLSPDEELHRLAGLASRNETFMEDDALILRRVAKHVVKVTAERDQLAAENGTLAVEVCRLNGVIRDLQGDLEVAQQEISRLENPDSDD